MARLSRLEDVLFPVSEQPVFVSVTGAPGKRTLDVPERKAIVDLEKHRVLGIVSRGYRLVSNREALDWGLQCCHAVFPETSSGEWEAKAIDAPLSGGHCFIDLMHNSTALDFGDVAARCRPDSYGPFIRVTNSYNGVRALSFDIGFFRKVCSNGLIVRDAIVRFKFTHLRREIGEIIEFEIAHDRLGKAKARFVAYIAALRACPIPHNELEPFVCRVLGLWPPKPLKPNTRQADDWSALSAHVAGLCNRYSAELGDNAYAVFNAVTEFASRPPANRLLHRERNSFQRSAGEWVSKFAQRCQEPEFRLTEYLSEMTAAKSQALNQVRSAPSMWSN